MHDLWKTKDCQLCDCLSYRWAGLFKADIPAPILISRGRIPISVVTANIKLLQSSLYSEVVEGIVKNGHGVLVLALVKIAKDIGKEGELEHHLDDGIEAVGGKTHVVHETVPVPALSIQDEVSHLLPEVPPWSENRDSTHVPHDAFKKGHVEEAHH